MSNPLVAQAQSQTTGVTGIGIAESAVDLANGVSDGSWVEAGLGAVGVGLEVLSLVVDPIGTLASYGVSWLIEHVQPLKEALDWLAGDPPVIQSFSDTWANVAAEVNAIAGDLGNEVTNGTAGWQGEGAEAYRGAAAEQADALAGAASLADGISAGVMIMGTVVAAVRELVRDLVAELVGKLITWALEAAATLGFATPAIAVQATTAITKTISKISEFIRKLVKTIGNVSPKIRKIIDKLGEIIEKLSKMLRKGGKPGSSTTPSGAKPSTTKTPDTTPNSPDSPDTTPSSTDTTPSGTDTPGSKPSDGTSPSGDSPSRPDNPRDTSTPDSQRKTCNDPIDIASGEMVLPQTDVELDGVLPLVLRRVHVSSYRAGRSFGRTWASTMDQRVELDARGAVFAADDGMLLVYPEPTGAGVLPEVGPTWPLRRTEHGFAIEQRGAGRPARTLHFAGAPGGREHPLTAITDPNGNRIDFHRDERGTVTAIDHSGGYHLDVDSADGLVTGISLAGPAGPVTLLRYGYTDAGHLGEVLNSSNLALRFDYDPVGRIVRWTDRNGEWYRYLYDLDGRCVANQGSGGYLNGTFGYDRAARVTRFTDALGNTTTFQLDEYGNVVAETDPAGATTRSEWDSRDRLVSRTDPLGRRTSYQYDEDGNVTVLTHPDGTTTVAVYNEFGLPTEVTDADGAVWRREYDDRGNLVASTDPAGAVTRYEVDERGRIQRITDPLGGVRTLHTDEAGLVLSRTDPLGARTRYTRDQFGRIVTVTDPTGGVSRFQWTVEGALLARSGPDGATERWRYDGEGNQVEHVDVLGQVTRTENTHFDLPSRVVRPDGSWSKYSYDANLRIIAIDDTNGAGWEFGYDAAGRIVREKDPNGRELRYRHDAAGQVVERTNAAGQTTVFHYDAAGNVVRTEAEDGVAEFEFDPMGRMLRAVNGHTEVRFRRDPLGRVLHEVTDGRGVESTYDPLGRRVRRLTATGAESTWEYDAGGRHAALRTAGHTMTFGYDQAGREVERLLDTGTIVAQSWDVAHRLTSQTVSVVGTGGARAHALQHRRYRYRADNQLVGIEDQLDGVRRFDLDPVGRVRGVDGPDGSERYSYDQLGTVVAAAVPVAGDVADGPREFAGTAVRGAGATRYERDPQGRVVLRQVKRLSAKPDTWKYEWNSQDLLTGVTTPDGSRWRYRYDALGRRVAKERLADDGSVAEAVRFTWDGLYLAEQEHTGGRTTTWDFEPGSFRPLTQVERTRDAAQEWVDERFYSIVTDLIGTPTELVGADGALAWRRRETVWGRALANLVSPASTPLRFPGQYHDPETGLNYNHQRYYDPEIGQYVSADPLGAGPGPNPFGYVPNPFTSADPLGLAVCPLKQIDEYRSRYQVGKGKNIAVARYEIDGRTGESVGVSGKHQYPGSAPMPAQPRFDPGYKNADSEWKMLEDIASGLSPGAQGKIHIYSERPVCEPCQGVVAQFREAFPGIELTYSDFGRG
ncbi:RHS repeat-associated core domain-containing protein [Amycolatopsis lurida]